MWLVEKLIAIHRSVSYRRYNLRFRSDGHALFTAWLAWLSRWNDVPTFMWVCHFLCSQSLEFAYGSLLCQLATQVAFQHSLSCSSVSHSHKSVGTAIYPFHNAERPRPDMDMLIRDHHYAICHKRLFTMRPLLSDMHSWYAFRKPHVPNQPDEVSGLRPPVSL